jgi:hypothetical protein
MRASTQRYVEVSALLEAMWTTSDPRASGP